MARELFEKAAQQTHNIVAQKVAINLLAKINAREPIGTSDNTEIPNITPTLESDEVTDYGKSHDK